MPRIHLHSATEAQRHTVTGALWCAADVYAEHARDFAFHYAFIARQAWALRAAQTFQRQAEDTRAVARIMRLV